MAMHLGGAFASLRTRRAAADAPPLAVESTDARERAQLSEPADEPSSASSGGQLDLRTLTANAGQIVELASTEQASAVSGEGARASERQGSRRKATTCSSSNGGQVAAEAEDAEEAALSWKLQVSSLQVAVLSTARSGTAQFVADRCTVSRTTLPGSSTLEVRTLRASALRFTLAYLRAPCSF